MNRVRLRNALTKLRSIAYDRNDHANRMIAPQEMLDFLAMAAGIKPVPLRNPGEHKIETLLHALRSAAGP